MSFVKPALQAMKVITVEPIIFLAFWSIPYLDHANNVILFNRFCSELYNSTVCQNITIEASFVDENNHIQGEVSRWIMYNKVLMAGPMLYTTIVLGAISDRYQRKLPMMVPAFGIFLGSIWMMIVALVPQLDVRLILISSFIYGITGYYGAALMATSAYLGVMTISASRTMRISIYEAVLCMGLVCGTATSGLIIDHINVAAVFGITAGINFLTMIYTAVRIVELHTVKQEKPLWYELCNFSHVVAYVKTIFRARAQHRRMYIHLIFMAFMIGTISNQGLFDILVLYLTKTRDFTNSMFSLFTGAQAVAQTIFNVFVMWILKKRMQLTEPVIMLISLIMGMISFCMIASSDHIVIWSSIIFVGFNGLSGGAGRGFLSKLVPVEEQGQVFAFIAMGQCLTALLASVIFNNFYPETLVIWDGLTPLIAGLLNLIGILFTVIVIIDRWRFDHTDEKLELLESSSTNSINKNNTQENSFLLGDIIAESEEEDGLYLKENPSIHEKATTVAKSGHGAHED